MAETNKPVYTLNDGKYLISIARKSILNYLTFKKELPMPDDAPHKLMEKSGVFVTLNKPDDSGKKNLRGCIGYILPVYPLVQATIQTAVSSAISDYRFPQVTIDEMKDIVIEVTILTPPEKIIVTKSEEYLSKIKIGRDGLIVKQGGNSGLLLPQVPVEWNWDVKEFLQHTCNKAGLPLNCWEDLNTEIQSFSGIIYAEETPNGEVKEKET
ncbi:MAG: TIGR00296 family protein [Asgard group archaeon]|nr:TIGR00296 family protein [Asgard group archaeon]